MKRVLSVIIVFMLVVGTLCSSMAYVGAAEVYTGKEMGSEAVGAMANSETVGAVVTNEQVGGAADGKPVGKFVTGVTGLDVKYIPSTGMIEAKPEASLGLGFVDVDSWTLSITSTVGKTTSITGWLDIGGKMSISAAENTAYSVQMTAHVKENGYMATYDSPLVKMITGFKAPTITRVVNLRSDQRVCFKTNGSISAFYTLYSRVKDKTRTGSWSSKTLELCELYYDSRTGEYGFPVYNGEKGSGRFYQYQIQPAVDKIGQNKSYSNVSGMTWLSYPKVQKAVKSGNKLRVSWSGVNCTITPNDFSGALRYELWCKVDNGRYSKVADVSQSIRSFTGNLKKGTHKYSYQVRAYRSNIGNGKPYSAFSKVYSVTATA